MAGDEIKLFILDEVLDADRRVDGPAWKNSRGPAQVVYDCPQIVIVNKPAGLAVDGPEDDTLLNRTLLYLNQQGEYKENDLYTPALCHRLESGCFLPFSLILFSRRALFRRPGVRAGNCWVR